MTLKGLDGTRVGVCTGSRTSRLRVDGIGKSVVCDRLSEDAARTVARAQEENTDRVGHAAIVPPVVNSDPQVALRKAFSAAIVTVLGPEHEGADPVVRASANPDFGDYQVNGAMALGKQLGRDPRDLAGALIDAVDLGDLAEAPEVAGPGFINIRLRSASVAAMLEAMDNRHLGVVPDPDTHPVAIDLCGVNVAKQMHVGHLRSTIIGDALARILERRGRVVHRENHLGDWGLPIAMVLVALHDAGADLDALTLDALNDAYRDAQLTARDDVSGLETALRCGAGPHRIDELAAQHESASAAQETAKAALVALQQGDKDMKARWRALIDCTMRSVHAALRLLNTRIGPEHNRGESFYQDRLADTVAAFEDAGLGVEDDGALVVRFANRERPLLIRKTDGGFLYATTDLAAVRYRTQDLGADRVIYAVDARQRDHFRDIFDAARLIGWDRTPDGATVQFKHVPFGSVLGADNRPLKTRSGENVTLASLLEEAISRAETEVRSRAEDADAPTHGLDDVALGAISRQIGIGAIKYADLSNDLARDYVFDMDRMIAFEGNTGPYMQYACARITSMLAKANDDWADTAFSLDEPAERDLALRLLQYGHVVEATATSLEPHRLCTYLYELAESFSGFYQACPVLKAEDALRRSRLRLADLARRVITDGLDLLGIETPERM